MKINCRILVVDDNVFLLAAFRRLLAPHRRIQVEVAAPSGREALQLLETFDPDIVLMDLMMPGLDGLETMKILAERPKRPVVVIMSSHEEEPYRDASLKAGADGFLPKSKLSSQLLSLIQELLPSHRLDTGVELSSTT